MRKGTEGKRVRRQRALDRRARDAEYWQRRAEASGNVERKAAYLKSAETASRECEVLRQKLGIGLHREVAAEH